MTTTIDTNAIGQEIAQVLAKRIEGTSGNTSSSVSGQPKYHVDRTVLVAAAAIFIGLVSATIIGAVILQSENRPVTTLVTVAVTLLAPSGATLLSLALANGNSAKIDAVGSQLNGSMDMRIENAVLHALDARNVGQTPVTPGTLGS